MHISLTVLSLILFFFSILFFIIHKPTRRNRNRNACNDTCQSFSIIHLDSIWGECVCARARSRVREKNVVQFLFMKFKTEMAEEKFIGFSISIRKHFAFYFVILIFKWWFNGMDNECGCLVSSLSTLGLKLSIWFFFSFSFSLSTLRHNLFTFSHCFLMNCNNMLWSETRKSYIYTVRPRESIVATDSMAKLGCSERKLKEKKKIKKTIQRRID